MTAFRPAASIGSGDLLQLLFGPCGDDNVGPGLRERDRRTGADAASRTGDDGDASIRRNRSRIVMRSRHYR